MGSCCCKKTNKEEYEMHQIENLREKVMAYSDRKIDRYNIVRNISFAMLEIAKKKIKGETKKEIVANIICEFLDPNAFPQEMARTIIENFIDDLYASFRKLFKRGCC
jgi:uncharacterized protein with von Willebrand factor type A (vWA) domain